MEAFSIDNQEKDIEDFVIFDNYLGKLKEKDMLEEIVLRWALYMGLYVDVFDCRFKTVVSSVTELLDWIQETGKRVDQILEKVDKGEPLLLEILKDQPLLLSKLDKAKLDNIDREAAANALYELLEEAQSRHPKYKMDCVISKSMIIYNDNRKSMIDKWIIKKENRCGGDFLTPNGQFHSLINLLEYTIGYW